MTMPIMGHLDPDFFEIMEDVKNMLREVYHTGNFMTLPISSTGTGAMETACVNVLGARRHHGGLPQRLLRHPVGRHRSTLRGRRARGGHTLGTAGGPASLGTTSCPGTPG